MKLITDVRELYGMVHELLVEIRCPNCGNILITTMSQAEKILIFGCICGDIDTTSLFIMNNFHNESQNESVICDTD